jgi:uncharacterized protein (TIGR01777 family)
MKILIFGSTGFIGRNLVNVLLEDPSNQIFVAVRNVDKATDLFNSEKVTITQWDNIYNKLHFESSEYDVVINLLGENIADKKWTNERKKEIYNSRIDGTTEIIKNLKKENIKVKKFIQFSAVGIYGYSPDSAVDESSDYGDDFLANVCIDWEKALLDHKDYFEDYLILRNGLVLGKSGGAIPKMLPAFKMGVGGKLADGEQMMSWIHIHDLIQICKLALTSNDYVGIMNSTTPFPISNKDFTENLGRLLRRPTLFTVPKFALKFALGELSSVLVYGQNVVPSKLKANKFHYRYPTMEVALKDVVSK